MLRVGISEVDITPELGLRMAGMLNPPQAEGVQWPLVARVVVLDDGINRAAVVTLDLLLLLASTVAELRQAITAGTGLAPDAVMINCSHTHRGPYTASLMDEPIDFEYLDLLRARLVSCMAEAWRSRRPARLRVGHTNAPGWTFNRRQIYNTDLGEQVGTQGPEWIDTFVCREGPEDDELRVLIAEGLDGACLGGLVNYTCHSTVMGGEPVYSADYPGVLTELLSQRYGGVFGFLQGCAGNQWAVDMSVDRALVGVKAPAASGPDYNRRMGAALAEKADEALSGGTATVAGSPVGVGRRVLSIPQRRPTPDQIAWAKWYLQQDPRVLDQDEQTRRGYGHAYTFYGNSPAVQEWFARETIGMWEWQRRAGARELYEDVEVQVISVGDVAFVGYAAEIFAEFGLRAKAESPFSETFAMELTNGWCGYVPTAAGFVRGGYEARLGYTSRLIPEAGDMLCEAAIDLLQELGGRRPG